MVIVALAFIGIIVGSLLTAAGTAYTLKRQELNAKDNFYYVEQAMQEIYTGVGMQTIEEMKSAYSYTIENMVRFDTDLGTYRTISDEEANKMFKEAFMKRIMESDYFKRGAAELGKTLQKYVTNKSVEVDTDKLSVVRNKDSIILKDVTVTRKMEYSTNAGGDYTQTISADIVISEPDFDVSFNVIDTDYSAIFEYALVADMGVEVKQDPANPGLSIAGNIYAASDYYNKNYNTNISSTPGSDAKDFKETGDSGIKYEKSTIDEKGNPIADVVSNTYAYTENGEAKTKKFEYEFSKVSNKDVDDDDNGYVNDYAKNPKYKIGEDKPLLAPFDGENDHSRYSGLYIDASNVSIQANTIIIPGSLAVMNESDLAVYGRADSSATPEIWADEIVLGGTSTKDKTQADSKYKGSSAIFRADVFVRDDTQLDADGTSFTIAGSYYGFGDGTSKDTRVFVDTVESSEVEVNGKKVPYKTVFQYVDDKGNVFNRGHFNSSAIAINGQNAALDFSHAKDMYIAGRAFVEFSRYGSEKEGTLNDSEDSAKNIKSTTYTYTPTVEGKTDFIRDYKTGESIAYKTSQVMYNVSTWTASPATSERAYDAVVIPEKLNVVTIGLYVDGKNKTPQNIDCLGAFFPAEVFNGVMPVTKQVVKGKEYSFIDFDKAWDVLEDASAVNGNPTLQNAAKNTITKFKDVDTYKKEYAYDYSLWANPDYYLTDSPAAELIDISKYTDYEYGDIDYEVNPANVTRYSSGVITVNAGNTFSMTTVDDQKAIADLLGDSPYISDASAADIKLNNKVIKAIDFSNDLEAEYNLIKWNLAHFKNGDIEKNYVQDVVAEYGEAAITPINKYVHMNKISDANGSHIDHKIVSDGATQYRIWASADDLIVDEATDLTGIIICKGDVVFADNVNSFTGMIISGGKIYVGKNMTSISAAPATCREILRQCMRKSSDKECVFFLNLFNGYEIELEEDDDPNAGFSSVTPMVSVNSIGFSDIVSMENWTRNVGGAYEGSN